MASEIKKAIAIGIIGTIISGLVLLVSTYFSTFATMADVNKINISIIKVNNKLDYIIKEISDIKKRL